MLMPVVMKYANYTDPKGSLNCTPGEPGVAAENLAGLTKT